MHTHPYHSPHLTLPLPCLKHPSILPLAATHWLSSTRGRVKNLSTRGIRQGNLEPTVLPHSFDNTRNKKMLSCPHPMLTLLLSAKPRAKLCACSQPWGNNNILFSDISIAPTNKIKVYPPIDSEHNLHQKILHTSFLVRMEQLQPLNDVQSRTFNFRKTDFS